MKKIMILPALALGVATLGACSEKAQNDTAEAGVTIAADANATTQNAVSDVGAATDEALGSAERSIDNAGDAIGNAADRAADSTGNAMVKAGNDLKN